MIHPTENPGGRARHASFRLASSGLLIGWLSLGILSAPILAATVRFELIDADTDTITPAMVCITDAQGRVRLPPDGRIMDQPSNIGAFIRGVDFDPHPNWIGPVRKMQGRGNNQDRSFVYELRPSIPYWREPVMYQVSGEFSIELPEGSWRVAVEHGLEYIPVVESFRTEAGMDQTRRIELERWIDLPRLGWWSGDVHVHHPTLQKTHRDFLLNYARAADLHVVNVLEMGHHLGRDFKQWGFGQEFRVQEGRYALVSGQEEPRSTFGHIIGLNTTSLARDVATYDFYDLAFQRIHAQRGALVGFAHFSWNGCDLPRGFPWYVTTGELDFIELLQFSHLNAMDYYDYLNLGFKLTAAAGSDTPWGSTIGEVRTYVHTGSEFNINAWFDNMKKGRTFVSNGPVLEFTVNDQLPGTELRLAADEKVRIKARVISHPAIGVPKALTLMGNDGVIRELTNAAGETTLSFELEHRVDQSQWLVLSAVCDNNALAHTTPVYVVVDGRPTWSPIHGPPVVRKQLESIAGIEAEFKGQTDARAQGILERLTRARTYYARLLEQMRAAR